MTRIKRRPPTEGPNGRGLAGQLMIEQSEELAEGLGVERVRLDL
jgi:hypothetical protein